MACDLNGLPTEMRRRIGLPTALRTIPADSKQHFKQLFIRAHKPRGKPVQVYLVSHFSELALIVRSESM